MSLLCGKNPALEAVNAIRDQIKAKLADKKSALSGLASQVSAITSKISELKAKITNFDSFQAELAGLVGADPAKIAAFKEKWKGKVAELDALVAKTTSGISDALDFCKDVPNVKMDPATGSTVQEAKESPTPNAAPAKPEPVKETVVVNTKKVSTGNSKVIPSELQAKYDQVRIAYNKEVGQVLRQKAMAINDKKSEIMQSAEYEIAKKSQSTFASQDNKPEIIQQVESLARTAFAAFSLRNRADQYFNLRESEIADDANPTTVDAYALKIQTETDTPIYEQMEDAKPWLEKTNTILISNSQTVKDYYNYQNNAS